MTTQPTIYRIMLLLVFLILMVGCSESMQKFNENYKCNITYNLQGYSENNITCNVVIENISCVKIKEININLNR